MKKLIAVVNVVAWSGFWAFGFLAFAHGAHPESHVIIALVLAFFGLVVGVVAYRYLIRAVDPGGPGGHSHRRAEATRRRAQTEEEA